MKNFLMVVWWLLVMKLCIFTWLALLAIIHTHTHARILQVHVALCWPRIYLMSNECGQFQIDPVAKARKSACRADDKSWRLGGYVVSFTVPKSQLGYIKSKDFQEPLLTLEECWLRFLPKRFVFLRIELLYFILFLIKCSDISLPHPLSFFCFISPLSLPAMASASRRTVKRSDQAPWAITCSIGSNRFKIFDGSWRKEHETTVNCCFFNFYLFERFFQKILYHCIIPLILLTRPFWGTRGSVYYHFRLLEKRMGVRGRCIEISSRHVCFSIFSNLAGV